MNFRYDDVAVQDSHVPLILSSCQKALCAFSYVIGFVKTCTSIQPLTNAHATPPARCTLVDLVQFSDT